MLAGGPDRRVVVTLTSNEQFLDPVVIAGGRYRAPSRPGCSAQMPPETLSRVAFPAGADWRAIGYE